MDKPSFKLVGAPCGHHGQYTFYKALRLTGATEKIIAIGDFFFVRVWQDSELVSIGELQLLWTDRVSDQTLVSLRLYFLPENTPEGRNLHGEDEVLAINDKVVLRADDLLSWICTGTEWRWGLRAVWRGACAPPADPARTAPLHHTKLDFSDVASEKNTIEVDTDAPGVVVFSYPRYCRYRALLARLDGLQADWLRDSLVAALGGYAAPTNNTRILYCKDTFEYPELEGHEFVCNHLAPRLKGRPRGRRRRAPHSPSPSPEPELSPSDAENTDEMQPGDDSHPTRRRLSLRNGAPQQSEDEDDDCKRIEETAEDRAFLQQLKMFYKSRNEPFKSGHTLKHWSLRALYSWVRARGGYEAAARRQLWRAAAPAHPARLRRHYERFLLPFENYERRNGSSYKLNGKTDCEPHTIATIDVTDSPLRDDDVKILRTPSPKPENLEKFDKHEKFEKLEKGSIDSETGEITAKDELIVKNAEELNREFLESLNKDEKVSKISVKPVDQLVEPAVVKMYEKDDKDLQYLDTQKISLAESPSPRAPPNGHAPTDLKSSRPAGRSSLRAVRVKPQRSQPPSSTPPGGVSSSPPAPLTNFGIHHPPPPHHDDDIVEVPYKPKTPEIIDLDEYPESPQAVKKKKLDILKERGLEVTALPPWQPHPQVLGPPLMLNPAVQHQIMTQAQLFQMYNIMPQNYGNGLQPPKVIQASSIFGTAGPEKTVYGNPKDPFMPPPHVLHGAPLKPLRTAPTTQPTPQDILDLTCKSNSPPPQKPAVEIVRVPSSPSPKLAPQNLSKNYTLVDGKAVVGSNLEITLVNKAQSPNKNRPPQKRSSNGKFMSTKTPTPPKDTYPKFTSPSHSNLQKKPPITIPSYQIREDSSHQNAMKHQNLSQIMDLQKNQNLSQIMDLQKNQNLAQIMDLQKNQNLAQIMDLQKNQNLAQIMELQKGPVPMAMDPYMALYSRLAGSLDARQLALYRDLVAGQLRACPPLHATLHNTPTTK